MKLMEKIGINMKIYMKISNDRVVKKGDKVLFYTEHGSHKLANGFYIIESLDLKKKRINAYPEDGDVLNITSFNPKTLF